MTKHITDKYSRLFIIIVLLLLISIGLFGLWLYLPDGHNLPYADSISRLNIARKVIDNLTPGLPQLGNVWLPLPQLLMLPLIWHTFMWHTGLAGALMSMGSYILGGYFVYQSARLISKSYLGSFLALSVYALNINIFYLQTTAMSEALFACTLAGTMFYFLKFFKSFNSYYLIAAALAMSAMTLTRYEGLAVLLPSIPLVFFYSWYKSKKRSKAEANTILYGALACLGFALWTIYLTVIFGDPLYWKNYYTTASVVKETGQTYYTQAKPLYAALWQYFTSSAWMVGLIPMILLPFAIIILFIRDLKDKTFYFLPVLLPSAIFLFMALTLQRNTPIVQPPLDAAHVFSSHTSFETGFNIRYGLLLLPWVAIMMSYFFIFRNIFIKILMSVLFVSLFGIQVYSYFYPTYSVIYRIPAEIEVKPYGDFVKWMQKNYDDGYILISASSHEDQMFELGFPYKTYIHEGTNKYWKESLDDPPRYAKWVVFDKGHDRDEIAKKPGIKTVLQRDYNLVYVKDQIEVYKIKKHVYFKI